ncbi:MAG TPA: hypothetical protein VNO43_12895 [Candidatus Eisenbacteria bacterium]|nr:hypothetical protein [Candidatus Eisenbacteria bacterium]
MTQALIISVGKSPEPIVARIAEHRPSFVVFFASEESIESIGSIKVRLEAQQIYLTNRNVMVGDPEDIESCYAKALECAEQGKFDDAMVRLYRALELGGQMALDQALGCGTDRVPVVRLPASLRDEYQRKYDHRDSPDFVQLPLEATYRLLEALDDPAGKRYASRAGEFKKVQFARNHSWLAHGLTPCQDETYDTLSSLVREILEIEPGPSFPKIEESA